MDHVLIVGAQRCGTTWLRELLSAQPDVAVALPLRPEPKFFLSPSSPDQGLSGYRSRHFAHVGRARIGVDKSTSYLEDPSAARRAATVVPDARVVVQLRDPVERAVSNWRFSQANGLEKLDLVSAFQLEMSGTRRESTGVSVSPFAYLARGQYVGYIERWMAAFPGQVRVQFLEEAHQAEVVTGLLEFVGVRHRINGDVPPLTRNSSRGPKPLLPEALKRELRAFYAQDDDDLRRLLGRSLPWDTDG